MKRMFTLAAIPFFLLLFSSSKAQLTATSQWTWMNGANAINQPGVYGTLGTPAPANRPGARGGQSAYWKDAAGNLWLFGGYDFNSFFLNDLWKYNPSANQWTWMKGASTGQYGTYGTLGTPAPANTPGGRYTSTCQTDAAGNFWLFGGYGYSTPLSTDSYANLNDLWKYNPATNQWTWISGANINSQLGTYGTQGTPAAANKPGARYSSVSWMDAAGNFWLFGGNAYSASGLDYFNDLWKYDPANNQWTWVNGANTTNQPGTYGTQGTPSPVNRPGARSESVSWTDAAGNFWLFGGSGFVGSGSRGYLNDLWKYNPSTNQWTWVSGANTTNQVGIYGTQGVAATANRPGARGAGVSWTDAAGNLWLFGGGGFVGSGNQGYLNDLWKYDPSANQWTWVKGGNITGQSGVYGTQGTPDPANRPGARAPSAAWTDAAGNVWLSGGAGGSGFFNDLWRLNSGNAAPLPVTVSALKAYQQATSIAVEWKAEGESGIIQYEIEKSGDGTVFNSVAVQTATGNNGSAIKYAWLDVNPLTGNNFYRIKSVSLSGENKYSRVVKVTLSKGRPAYEVYPNPVTNGLVQLQLINQAKGSYRWELVNALGQVMQAEQFAHENGSSTETLSLSSRISRGHYTLLITAPDKSRQMIKIIY